MIMKSNIIQAHIQALWKKGNSGKIKRVNWQCLQTPSKWWHLNGLMEIIVVADILWNHYKM